MVVEAREAAAAAARERVGTRERRRAGGTRGAAAWRTAWWRAVPARTLRERDGMLRPSPRVVRRHRHGRGRRVAVAGEVVVWGASARLLRSRSSHRPSGARSPRVGSSSHPPPGGPRLLLLRSLVQTPTQVPGHGTKGTARTEVLMH